MVDPIYHHNDLFYRQAVPGRIKLAKNRLKAGKLKIILYMTQVNSHKVGIVFGGLFAIWHAIWAVMVFMGIAKPFMDWILGLHFLNFQYSVDPFAFSGALMLVIVTGIIGYIIGFIFGWLWNLAHRAAHGQ